MRTDRRRVLVLIKGLGLGGAEKLIAEAAPLWDADSFEYSVAYVLPWKDQLVPAVESAGTRVSCIGGARGLDPLAPVRLRRLIAATKPDLIHAHLPSAGILARVSTSVPVVYTEHNIVDSYRQPTRALNRLTYGLNDAVIAVSEPVAQSLAGHRGPDPVVIPNGVSLETPSKTGSELRSELGIEPSRPLVVHVGNIRPHKGHSNLVAATAFLLEHVPDVMVLSAGAEKHEGDLARITRAADEAGVAANLRFLGRRDDARSLIAAADVVVNPSDVEGLPVTLLEALIASKPVVATDVGGVSSIIQHERTGLLVPPGDPQSLAKAIERALVDDDAASWGARGMALVRDHHSIESMVRDYERIYRELLDD